MVLFYDISYISSVPSIILVYTSMASISKQYIFSGVLNHSIAFKTMSVFVCCAVFIFISLLFICFLNYMRSVFCNYKGNFGNNTISYNEIFCVFFCTFRKIDAFVYDYTTVAFEASKRRECDLKVVGNPFFESSLGMALAKNSFLTSKISERLSYYKQYGIERKLRNTWFQGYCQSNKAPNVAQISIESMGGLFLAVGIGVIVATIYFFLRHCFFQILNWRRYNISN